MLLADEALHKLYTPFLSLKLAEMLIFFGKYTQHTSSHALGLKAKGDALVQIGHHQAAIDSLDAAAKEFMCLEDKGNWARSRISWITASESLGRVEEALEEAVRARDVFLHLNEYLWVCIIDNNVAVIYDHIGRYQDALNLYESMLATYPTLTGQSKTSTKRDIAIAEVNQAISLSWLGEFEQAYHLHEKAQSSFIELEETSLVIHSEIYLASLDYTQGYYGSALRRYYQARDTLIQSNADNPRLLIELKLWTANCLVKLNRVQEACQLAEVAVREYRQLGASLQASNALCEYAATLVACDRLKEALAVLDEAWLLFNDGGFDHYAFATRLQQAELLLEMSFFTEAYYQANLIKEYFESQGLVARSVRASLVMVGSLIERAQQTEVFREKVPQTSLLEEAMLLCRQTAIRASQHNLQEVVYKSQYLMGRISVLQNKTVKAAKHYGAAIAQIERMLDDLVYDLSPSFLRMTWAVYEEMIVLCLQQNQMERAFSYLEQARSMALRQYLNKSSAVQSKRGEQKDSISPSTSRVNNVAMWRMQQELKDWQEKYRHYNVLLTNIDLSVSPTVDREVIEAELKRCETKLGELFERLTFYQAEIPLQSHAKKRTHHGTKQIDTVRLRQQLIDDELLLAYFLYKGKLIIFAVTTESVTAYEITNGMEQIERLVPLLHAHLQPGGWPNIQRPPQQIIHRLLNKLYNLLVAPVVNLLPTRSCSLTIVPYGPLHALPFHALHDGSHFLIENFQINYLPASNILMHLGNYKDAQVRHLMDKPLPSDQPLVLGYSGNGHLRRTIDEAEMLATLLNGRCYLENDATIARLIEQSPHSPIIHIATHGQNRLDAPNFSYVLLADGQLNAIDAFNLNLQGCELVTLSGCETGLALSGGGDEQLGLGRAFLAAGARSLVMSLWSVEDNATNELMQCFYQHLLNGESKVQALRAAQCELLHSPTSNYSHPYFWAAFRLVGDGSPLQLREQKLVIATSLLSC
ncbi:MAG: CHAT domain-containing protein [Ktedonobacteraceae bacterium]